MAFFTPRRVTGIILAAAGVLTLVAEVWLHLYAAWTHGPEYQINHGAVGVGMILGFAGFGMLNKRDAEELLGALVSNGTKLIVAVRTGRRSSDVKVMEVEPSEAATSDHPTGAG